MMRLDGQVACDLFSFVDDERITGLDEELTWQASHTMAAKQSYLGVQDVGRKARPSSKQPGAWAGAIVNVVALLGVCVLTLVEKWAKMRAILKKWPWCFKRAPLLVETGRDLRKVLLTGEGNGGDLLRKLVKLPGLMAPMLECMACGVLHVPWATSNISDGDDQGRNGKSVAQGGREMEEDGTRSKQSSLVYPVPV